MLILDFLAIKTMTEMLKKYYKTKKNFSSGTVHYITKQQKHFKHVFGRTHTSVNVKAISALKHSSEIRAVLLGKLRVL